MSESKELQTLEDMQNELALLALQEGSSEKVTTSRHLSVKGRRFTLGDERLGEELDVVVVATAFENAYYKSAYNPDKVAPPACFAVAHREDDLGPHETAPEPQGDMCKTCPMNEWGSGTGKGKACKNGRRLLLLAMGKDGLQTDEVVTLRLPPTSIKNWASYAKVVTARTNLPTFAVVTRLSFDPKSDWPVVKMDFVRAIDSAEEMQHILANKDSYLETVIEPYDVSSYEAEEELSISDKKKSKMS